MTETSLVTFTTVMPYGDEKVQRKRDTMLEQWLLCMVKVELLKRVKPSCMCSDYIGILYKAA
jgi:hypothetical protein